MANTLSVHDLVTTASGLPQLKKLIAAGADVNQPGFMGRYPIHIATNLGLTKTVQVLIDAGADLNVRSDIDMTPLMIACSNGQTKGSAVALVLIKAGARINEVRAADGMTALKFAAGSATDEVIKALLAGGAPVDGEPGTDMTPLMFAAMNGNIPAIDALVQHGADLFRQRTGKPPLGGLTAKGHAKEWKNTKAFKHLEKLEQQAGKP
jgi:ankyrin repeat protein